MVCSSLDLTVIAARDLKDVNLISKMDAYVVVSLDGDPRGPQKFMSPIDRDGGRNPAWNFPVKLLVDKASAQQGRLILLFKLRCDRALGDKDIGDVIVPVKELLDFAAGGGVGKASSHPLTVTYQVRKPSGKPKGELHFSYKFSDKLAADVAAADHHPPPAPKADVAAVTAYLVQAWPSRSYGAAYLPPQHGAYQPPPPPPAAAVYLPPPQHCAYGYPLLPLAGYGYAQAQPPPPAGYGYYPNQQAQQALKNNKLGLGLGAGLAGKFFGGMLIGGMLSGADGAGFDDYGGF